MAGKRRWYSAEFKAKVALEAIRGEATIAELVQKYGVRQTLIVTWRRQAIEGMAGVFSGKVEAAAAEREGELEKLHAKIGQGVVERDFYRRPPDDERRPEAVSLHGLRKALGRRIVEAGGTAHEVMAAPGHLSLVEAERYTRTYARKAAASRAIGKVEARGFTTQTRRDVDSVLPLTPARDGDVETG